MKLLGTIVWKTGNRWHLHEDDGMISVQDSVNNSGLAAASSIRNAIKVYLNTH